jgi:hypothetical protein
VVTAWRTAGWRDELSEQTPTGPVITIICQALEAIDGREHQPAQVLSALDRQNAKVQRKGRSKFSAKSD